MFVLAEMEVGSIMKEGSILSSEKFKYVIEGDR